MFTLRHVARAAAPAPTQTRALAAKAKGERLTWRQKEKIAALRQKKNSPLAEAEAKAKPPRAKIVRENFLKAPEDDGKKWRILSASVLERLPIIQPDLEDWEMDWAMVEHEIALKEDQVRGSARD
jgi:hypothetical protein